MSEIKPIETLYKGYRFRSRLEARWAVFFDEIGADWLYEPEGFELPDGTKYLPDFLIKNVQGRGAKNIYVEIKGELTDKDLHKIEMFADPDRNGCPDGAHPLIIFGQIPDCEWIKPSTYEYIDFMHGGWCLEETPGYWSFDFNKDKDEHFYNLVYSEGDYYWTHPMAGRGGGLVLDYPDDPYDFVDVERTAKAFEKARQARFEHGESPER